MAAHTWGNQLANRVYKIDFTHLPLNLEREYTLVKDSFRSCLHKKDKDTTVPNQTNTAIKMVSRTRVVYPTTKPKNDEDSSLASSESNLTPKQRSRFIAHPKTMEKAESVTECSITSSASEDDRTDAQPPLSPSFQRRGRFTVWPVTSPPPAIDLPAKRRFQM